MLQLTTTDYGEKDTQYKIQVNYQSGNESKRERNTARVTRVSIPYVLCTVYPALSSSLPTSVISWQRQTSATRSPKQFQHQSLFLFF